MALEKYFVFSQCQRELSYRRYILFKIKDAENIVLDILKYNLFNIPLDIRNKYSKEINCQAVLKEAYEQAVLPLVVQGLLDSAVYKIDKEIFAKWKAIAVNQITFNEKLMQKQDEIISLLHTENIPSAILKGTSASAFYPKPELRVLGDIDILFNESECPKAVELFCKNGFVKRGSSAYRKRHNYKLYFFCFIGKVSGSFINFTYGKAYKKTGIGLRQLCDWAVFIQKRIDESTFRSEIEPILCECGLIQFTKIVTKVCVLYLGLPIKNYIWCNDIDVQVCEQFILLSLKSGNFGKKNVLVRSAKIICVDRKYSNKCIGLVKTVFINIIISTKKRFPICNKYPLLILFMWIYIPCKYFVKNLFIKGKKTNIFSLFLEAKRKKLFDNMKLFRIE